MSNIFLKNNLKDIFDSATETELNLPKYITIIDKANETEAESENKNTNMNGGSLSQLQMFLLKTLL
jgi:hypothetical protein